MPLAMSTCMVDVRKPGRYSNIEGDLRTIFAATERKFRPSDLMIYLLLFFLRATRHNTHAQTVLVYSMPLAMTLVITILAWL